MRLRVEGLGFRVWGLRFRGSGFGVEGVGVSVQGAGSMLQGLGRRTYDLRFSDWGWVHGPGFRVPGFGFRDGLLESKFGVLAVGFDV